MPGEIVERHVTETMVIADLARCGQKECTRYRRDQITQLLRTITPLIGAKLYNEQRLCR